MRRHFPYHPGITPRLISYMISKGRYGKGHIIIYIHSIIFFIYLVYIRPYLPHIMSKKAWQAIYSR